MARRKKQAIPVVVTPYALTAQRELADTALEDARTLIARHDVGVTDDTIDIWQTLRDLSGVVADMPQYQSIIDEHEADAKAADERANEAEKREREHSAEADQRCYRATEIEQQLRAEIRRHEYQIEQLSASIQAQSVELDTLHRGGSVHSKCNASEDSHPRSVRTRYATYSARGPSGMSPTAINRDREMAQREHGDS